MINRRIANIIYPHDSTNDCFVTMADEQNIYEWHNCDINGPWILHFKNGVEVERINPRYVLSISWLDIEKD